MVRYTQSIYGRICELVVIKVSVVGGDTIRTGIPSNTSYFVVRIMKRQPCTTFSAF